MKSCLYDCRVMHQRLRPRQYGFRHRIMMLYVDLAELDEIDRCCRLLSHRRRTLYTLREHDYCPSESAGGLRDRVNRYLAGRGIALEDGDAVRLLTLPRMLGYAFNPISVYFCFRAAAPLCAIAEVGNTFGETKLFLLPLDTLQGERTFRTRIPKQYYVSPFSRLDISFEFNLRTPDERLRIRVDDWDESGRLLASQLLGRRVHLGDRELASFALKFPLLGLKVIGLIHWHALRLAWRGLPWHRKAELPELQTDVLNRVKS